MRGRRAFHICCMKAIAKRPRPNSPRLKHCNPKTSANCKSGFAIRCADIGLVERACRCDNTISKVGVKWTETNHGEEKQRRPQLRENAKQRKRALLLLAKEPQ